MLFEESLKIDNFAEAIQTDFNIANQYKIHPVCLAPYHAGIHGICAIGCNRCRCRSERFS